MNMYKALEVVLNAYAGRLNEISKPAIRKVLGMNDTDVLMSAENEIIVSFVSTASYRIYCARL